MKNAIKIAILASFVFVAVFGCTQTVTNNGSGLFLASETIQTSNTNSTETNLQETPSTSNGSEEEISNTSASETITPTKPTSDEGSLPLFPNMGNLASSTTDSQIKSFTDPISTALSVITSFIGIIIVIFVISWFIQKKTGLGANNFGKVIGILPLDNKRFIYIVDVMGKMLVLGVTESNINFLTEITDKDTVDAYRLKYGQSITPGLDKLFPFIKKPGTNENSEEFSEEADTLKNQTVTEVIEDLKDDRDKKITHLKDLLIKKD